MYLLIYIAINFLYMCASTSYLLKYSVFTENVLSHHQPDVEGISTQYTKMLLKCYVFMVHMLSHHCLDVDSISTAITIVDQLVMNSFHMTFQATQFFKLVITVITN